MFKDSSKLHKQSILSNFSRNFLHVLINPRYDLWRGAFLTDGTYEVWLHFYQVTTNMTNTSFTTNRKWRSHVIWSRFLIYLKGYLILLWHEVGSCKHLLDFPCFPIHKVENCLYFEKHTFEQYRREREPH